MELHVINNYTNTYFNADFGIRIICMPEYYYCKSLKR